MPICKTNDGIEINYIKEGEGEPLVLIAGFGTKWQSWQYQIDFFKDKMTVIAIDNRGCGKSSRPDYKYTMDMYVDDIKHVLDDANITEKIHLCGISLGGMLVQNFALKYPDLIKTLILCATLAYADATPIISTLDSMKHLDLESRLNAVIPMVFARPFRKRLKVEKGLLDEIKGDIMYITHMSNPPQENDYYNQFGLAYEQHDTRETIHTVNQPTLIMGGDKDRIIPVMALEFLHKEIPNSKLVVFEGFSHAFPISNADGTNTALWDFLSENLN